MNIDQLLVPQVQKPRIGGSKTGRLTKRSKTQVAGIRFEWIGRSCGPILRVVATWTAADKQAHHTSFSVETCGLEGALDRAILARTSAGAPAPDRAALLEKLKAEFATKGALP